MTAPSFDLRLVPSFVAVAEELHFGRAADRLRIAQPALSRQIARLEEQLGTALLVRSTREVALTPAGELFLAAGRDVVRRAARARATVDEDRGEIVVHLGPALHPRINELVSAFVVAHPGVRVRMLTASLSESSAAVLGGQADVGFDIMEGVPSELGYATVDRPLAGVVCAPGHRLATRPGVGWGDLEGERLIMAPPGLFDGSNAFVRAHLRTSGVLCEEVHGAVHSQLNYAQIAAGLGLLVVVEYVYTMLPPGLVWLPLHPTNRYDMGVTWHPRRLGATTRRFVRWIRAEAARDQPGTGPVVRPDISI